jgi:hypothetical protein
MDEIAVGKLYLWQWAVYFNDASVGGFERCDVSWTEPLSWCTSRAKCIREGRRAKLSLSHAGECQLFVVEYNTSTKLEILHLIETGECGGFGFTSLSNPCYVIG